MTQEEKSGHVQAMVSCTSMTGRDFWAQHGEGNWHVYAPNKGYLEKEILGLSDVEASRKLCES